MNSLVEMLITRRKTSLALSIWTPSLPRTPPGPRPANFQDQEEKGNGSFVISFILHKAPTKQWPHLRFRRLPPLMIPERETKVKQYLNWRTQTHSHRRHKSIIFAMDGVLNASAAAVNATAAAATSIDFNYRVRATFYALTLEETYIKDVKDVPQIQVLTIPIMMLMTLVELVVLRLQGKGDKFRLHNTVLNYATGSMNEAARVFVLRGAEFSAYIWLYNNMRITTLPWDSPWTYVFALLGVDFCNYWWHRMGHELSFMWAAHYVHHSSEDFNASVGARLSFTMRPFKWLYFTPLAMVGLPPSTFLVHSQLGYIWAFWVHCEAWPKTQKIIPVFGHIIEFFMSTPSHHRVHHGANKYCIDKNYGTTLIIWDRMFGTFVEEREDEPLTYGVLFQKDNNHLMGLNTDPWRDLWNRIRSVETLGDKVRTVFYGPGWAPGKPRLGDHNDIPDVRGRKKHAFIAPWWFSQYVAFHCFILFVLYMDSAARVVHLSQFTQKTVLIYIIVTFISLGGLYSNHQPSYALEPVRLIASVPLFLLLPMFASERLSTAAATINLLSLLMWPAVKRVVTGAEKKVE